MRLLLLFVLIAAFSCDRRSETTPPRDFYLIYQDDIDKIDLESNTLTRKYIGLVKTIEVDIGKESIKKIFEFIIDNGVMRFDDSSLKNDCDVQMLPQASYKLEIMIDKSQEKTFVWTSNHCGGEIDILTNLTSLIKEQTKAQVSIGKLQPTNITAE